MSNIEGERLMENMERAMAGEEHPEIKPEPRSLIPTGNRLLPRASSIMASVADLSQKIEALRDKIRGVLPVTRPTVVKMEASASKEPQGMPSTFDATERQLAAAHKVISELHEMF
jgi:hypothetical protein